MKTIEYTLFAFLVAVVAFGMLTVFGETSHNIFQALANFFEG